MGFKTSSKVRFMEIDGKCTFQNLIDDVGLTEYGHSHRNNLLFLMLFYFKIRNGLIAICNCLVGLGRTWQNSTGLGLNRKIRSLTCTYGNNNHPSMAAFHKFFFDGHFPDS